MMKEPKLITTLEDFSAKFVSRGTYHLLQGEYAHGGTAIMAQTEEGELAFVLSVYLDGHPPRPEGFWAKDWSENEGIVEELVKRGIIELNSDHAYTGYVVAQGAQLTKEYR